MKRLTRQILREHYNLCLSTEYLQYHTRPVCKVVFYVRCGITVFIAPFITSWTSSAHAPPTYRSLHPSSSSRTASFSCLFTGCLTFSVFASIRAFFNPWDPKPSSPSYQSSSASDSCSGGFFSPTNPHIFPFRDHPPPNDPRPTPNTGRKSTPSRSLLCWPSKTDPHSPIVFSPTCLPNTLVKIR